MRKKALVAMSGGVDSSVCAYLAQKEGYDLIGATMRLCEKDAFSKDAEDARIVCDKLGISHYVFDMTKEFKEKVIKEFVSLYEMGFTPNPCILCNKNLKFGLLLDKARELGCDTIITGHYARVEMGEDGYELKKALDVSKDQSYVLYQLPYDMLENVYFPLGTITKEEARKIASQMDFVTAHKSDSQDICFVPDGDYASYIKDFTGKEYPKGSFVDTKGNVLGEHRGIIHYTIGQRKGLGIALGTPGYVKSKNTQDNTVVISSNDELFSNELTAKDFNWVIRSPKFPLKAKAKIRYNQKETNATVYMKSDNEVKIIFEEPQRAIAKGQAVVVYDGDRVLGGGTIA